MDGNVNNPVECYSGVEYPERPLAFIWQGTRLEVDEILESHRIPEGKFFRVTTKDGQSFALRYDQLADRWSITPG